MNQGCTLYSRIMTDRAKIFTNGGSQGHAAAYTESVRFTPRRFFRKARKGRLFSRSQS